MKLKISEREPIIFFVKVKGPNGTREFRAALDTGCTDCIISLQDARALGYNAYFEPYTRVGEGTLGISITDIFETDEIVLQEVSLGNLVAKDVKAMTRELPRFSGIEGIIGISFLRQFKTCLNFAEGYLEIEPIVNTV